MINVERPLIEAGLSNGRQYADASLRASALHQAAVKQIMDDLQTLSRIYSQFGQAYIVMRQDYHNEIQRLLERMRQNSMNIYESKSITDFFDQQQAIYYENVNTM